MQTPKFDDVKDEKPVPLDPEQISKYRSHVARCLFLSKDGAEKTFAVDELCQRTSDPSQHSFIKLKEHLLKANTRKQKIIAQSSAEAELCAAALGTSEAKGVQSMKRDWVCSEASIDR